MKESGSFLRSPASYMLVVTFLIVGLSASIIVIKKSGIEEGGMVPATRGDLLPPQEPSAAFYEASGACAGKSGTDMYWCVVNAARTFPEYRKVYEQTAVWPGYVVGPVRAKLLEKMMSSLTVRDIPLLAHRGNVMNRGSYEIILHKAFDLAKQADTKNHRVWAALFRANIPEITTYSHLKYQALMGREPSFEIFE